jgi:hypothetical protein
MLLRSFTIATSFRPLKKIKQLTVPATMSVLFYSKKELILKETKKE